MNEHDLSTMLEGAQVRYSWIRGAKDSADPAKEFNVIVPFDDQQGREFSESRRRPTPIEIIASLTARSATERMKKTARRLMF
jgi:hypothetical protein